MAGTGLTVPGMNTAQLEAAPRAVRQRGDHPTERTLRRFAVGTTSRAENRTIVSHLLRRCDRCSRALAETVEGGAR